MASVCKWAAKRRALEICTTSDEGRDRLLKSMMLEEINNSLVRTGKE